MTIIEGYGYAYTKTGISLANNFVKVEYVGTVRFYYGALIQASYYNQLNNCLISTSGEGIAFNSWYSTVNNCVSVLAYYRCLYQNSLYGSNVISNCKFYGSSIFGIILINEVLLYTCDIANNQSGDISFDSADDIGTGAILARHLKLGSSTEVNAGGANRGILWSYDHDDTTSNHWGFTYQGTINWQTAVFQGADPGSWKVAVLGSSRTTLMPIRLKLAEVAVSASSLVTFKAWVKKDHATNVGAKIYVLGSDYTIDGVVAASATKANDTNWEELTITFTPTQAGVVDIYGEAWYSAGNSNVYFGSITVTQ